MAIKYDNCNDCHSRCVHAGKDRKFVCINGVSCKITTEKPQTNADRIRAMSDEELVGFLMRLMGHEQCFADGIFPYHPCPRSHNCKQCGIDWLQQPAEEERK